MDNLKKTEELKEKYRSFILRLDLAKDEKIIKHLEKQGNIQEYIKKLVENDMK